MEDAGVSVLLPRVGLEGPAAAPDETWSGEKRQQWAGVWGLWGDGDFQTCSCGLYALCPLLTLQEPVWVVGL